MLESQNLNKVATFRISVGKVYCKSSIKERKNEELFDAIQKNLMSIENLCLMGAS